MGKSSDLKPSHSFIDQLLSNCSEEERRCLDCFNLSLHLLVSLQVQIHFTVREGEWTCFRCETRSIFFIPDYYSHLEPFISENELQQMTWQFFVNMQNMQNCPQSTWERLALRPTGEVIFIQFNKAKQCCSANCLSSTHGLLWNTWITHSTRYLNDFNLHQYCQKLSGLYIIFIFHFYTHIYTVLVLWSIYWHSVCIKCQWGQKSAWFDSNCRLS